MVGLSFVPRVKFRRRKRRSIIIGMEGQIRQGKTSPQRLKKVSNNLTETESRIGEPELKGN